MNTQARMSTALGLQMVALPASKASVGSIPTRSTVLNLRKCFASIELDRDSGYDTRRWHVVHSTCGSRCRQGAGIYTQVVHLLSG